MKENKIGLVLLIMLLLGWTLGVLVEYVTYNSDTTDIIVTYLK